jgi:hypothetical protein
LLQPSIKSSLSGTNIARIVFLVVVVVGAVAYYELLPKPPPPDFTVTGFSGFDVETSSASPSFVQTLRINSASGFSGTVTLSLGGITYPSGTTGTPPSLTIQLSSTTVTVPSGSYASVDINWWANSATWDSYLSSTTSAPGWSLTLTATGGGNTHTYTATGGRIVNMITNN